jgi:hypothetical protein
MLANWVCTGVCTLFISLFTPKIFFHMHLPGAEWHPAGVHTEVCLYPCGGMNTASLTTRHIFPKIFDSLAFHSLS